MLPDRWIQRIFTEMRANYGAAFDRMWQAPAGADPEEHARQLLSYWARELSTYLRYPEAIRHALDHLPPGFPPDLPAFKLLCREGIPREERLALPPPRERTARTDEVLAMLRAVRERCAGQPITTLQRASDRSRVYAESEDTITDVQERRAATARRVAEYAQRNGLEL